MKIILIVAAFSLLLTDTTTFAQLLRRSPIQQQYEDPELINHHQALQNNQQENSAPKQVNNNYNNNNNNKEYVTPIPIIRFDKEQGDDGSYKTLWETGNNILAQEEGYIKQLGPDPDEEGGFLAAQVQQGSYSYTAPDGQIITVNYIADEKGFHATGDHLPTPPPVSPEVQKGLDLIYAGIKAQQESDEREAKAENPININNHNKQQQSSSRNQINQQEY